MVVYPLEKYFAKKYQKMAPLALILPSNLAILPQKSPENPIYRGKYGGKLVFTMSV